MPRLGGRRRVVIIVFGTAALILTAVFTSLGIWQLRRLGERRAQNAMLSARRFLAPLNLDSVPGDTAAVKFRRVRVKGAYDYSREFALTLRTRNGSPGVNIITPLKRAGIDTLVLVNRGWIYAPDGMSADLSRWREGDSVDATGFIETFQPGRGFAAASPGRARAYRWLDRAQIERDVEQPVSGFYVVLAPDSNSEYVPRPDRAESRIPPRVEPRSLDEGPHKSYAIQWFSFAAISIFGSLIFLKRE